jgi:hypothetical protein
LFPVVVVFVADLCFTLAGQPETYWAGDYATATESNPLVKLLLIWSPGWVVVLALAWLALLSAIILWWPSGAWGWRVAVVVALVHTLAHAVASASWLVRPGGWSWCLAVAYLTAAAEGSWWCWRRAGQEKLSTAISTQ